MKDEINDLTVLNSILDSMPKLKPNFNPRKNIGLRLRYGNKPVSITRLLSDNAGRDLALHLPMINGNLVLLKDNRNSYYVLVVHEGKFYKLLCQIGLFKTILRNIVHYSNNDGYTITLGIGRSANMNKLVGNILINSVTNITSDLLSEISDLSKGAYGQALLLPPSKLIEILTQYELFNKEG